MNEGGGASRSTEHAAGSSAATDVSLREFVNEGIRNTKYLIGFVGGIGVFAWFEIQRRLEILNHENARLLAQQEKTVSEDTYKEVEKQRLIDDERSDARFSNIEKFQNKLLGAVALCLVLVPGVTAVVVYLLTRHSIPSSP